MSSQQMTNPELNSVHSVKILLCYILDRLDRPVTEEQLRLISEDSEIINYFYFSDALEELIKNDSVISEKNENGNVLTVTEKGRLGSEYFNRYIPLVFRKKLLQAAFSFFVDEQNRNVCSCDITDIPEGCNVRFRLHEKSFELIDMTFYAPDKAQAELISDKIMADPVQAYKNILHYLLDNKRNDIDVEKFL